MKHAVQAALRRRNFRSDTTVIVWIVSLFSRWGRRGRVRGGRLMLAVIGVAVMAASCGTSEQVGDCSNGTFDGQGGCIPNWHAPRLVEAVAIRHFHGKPVDRVGCYLQRRFRYHGRFIHVWGCWRVADGVLTHDLACVAASRGRPLASAVRAAIPARRLRCRI